MDATTLNFFHPVNFKWVGKIFILNINEGCELQKKR